MMPKPKAYSSKKKKIQGIDAQKLSCIDKSMKNGSQMKKLSIYVNTLVKSHICSFVIVLFVYNLIELIIEVLY